MIRFVDLRGAETGKRFAYYNTDISHFVEANGFSGWDTFQEFVNQTEEDVDLERFKKITPYWACMPGPQHPPDKFLVAVEDIKRGTLIEADTYGSVTRKQSQKYVPYE